MKKINKYCFEHVKDYYEQNINSYSENHQILGWESREAQHIRFSVLVDNVDLYKRSLLDVGCGLGDLFFYLCSQGVELEQYYGVDISEVVVNKALEMNPHLNIEHRDIFSDQDFAQNNSYDVVYASGIYNLKQNNNINFLEESLSIYKKVSKEYVVFNLLSEKSEDKEDAYYYYSSNCITELVRKFKFADFSIIEDYLHNDFTVICKVNNES